MQGQEVLLSSKSTNWSTPQDLFDELDAEFFFDLDPCASDENHKCPRYYTEDEDGLSMSWTGRIFMNPPYGTGMSAWIQRAHKAVYEEQTAELVVLLLPARTDTIWFHRYCVKREIRFIKGRLRFGDAKNTSTFPSIVVVFERK